MNTESVPSSNRSGRRAARGAPVLLALFAFAAGPAIADQGAATTTVSNISVPLSDLNLSTSEGMHKARDRLHTVAERLCRERGASHPAFGTCVESTVANALRQLNALKQNDMTARSSMTLGARVSLADLDLSTLEGSRAAHERLEAMARRLCNELAGHHELVYQPSYAACVQDTLSGAWAQANAIRATSDKRTALRATP